MSDRTKRTGPGAVPGLLALAVLGGMALGGCASRGDLEQVRQETRATSQATQASIEAAKQQLVASQQELEAAVAKDRSEFDSLAKENEALRAALARVSQALKDYLKTEAARHEEGLAQIRAAQEALK